MAKAKKETGESTTGAAAPKAAASKTPDAPAAKSKKAKKPAAPGGAPSIDTSLAAQTAANMVANRDRLPSANAPAGEKRETGAFKQLKQSFLKPAVQGPGGLLQQQGNQKKSNQGFGGRNQVGHNQTFGADVNRAGVPRRTGGG